MGLKRNVGLSIGIAAVMAAGARAHIGYTGYSGAPGTTATCGDCHNGIASGGTVAVVGFPTSYTPGSTYTLTVSHNGSIDNFNASLRIGTTAVHAGTVSAGVGTSIYTTPHDTGAHFTDGNLSTGTFIWTAPGMGRGMVTLYLGAVDGVFPGTQTVLKLTSTEGPMMAVLAGTSAHEQTIYLHLAGSRSVVIPMPGSPLTSGVVGTFRIISLNGVVVSIPVSSDMCAVSWQGLTNEHRMLPAGNYVYSLELGRSVVNGKLIVSR